MSRIGSGPLLQGIPLSDTPSCHARGMGNWAMGEVLAFDFETTGVDRFNDVPVSYALVTVVGGEWASTCSGLVDPGRDIPPGATEVHGITTERARAEGIPLAEAIELVADAVILASRRGVPLVGMKLDYDLTILDTQCRDLSGGGLLDRGWCGPVLDAVVLDRHLDRFREGSRTLGALCAHYGVSIENAHDAVADAMASAGVLVALATCFAELAETDPHALHAAQIGWHREWAESYDGWRTGQGMTPMDARDFIWPVAPAIVPTPLMRLTA
jgi:DNA polymerase III subunit epsilon